ncbi:hypothetical protein HZH68_008970 [Vespula germanica]|uniref:Uncharacterized protein n=1 Tax=Vespula germanica TaxID=30212 RepID=A0A834JZY6_VESGE|nr:hypothetical protein HZH68_008970 [Vespula germanica]
MESDVIGHLWCSQLSESIVRVCKDDKSIPNISKLNGFEGSETADDDNTNRNKLVEEELIPYRDNKLLSIISIHLYRSTDELIKVKDVGLLVPAIQENAFRSPLFSKGQRCLKFVRGMEIRDRKCQRINNSSNSNSDSDRSDSNSCCK